MVEKLKEVVILLQFCCKFITVYVFQELSKLNAVWQSYCENNEDVSFGPHSVDCVKCLFELVNFYRSGARKYKDSFFQFTVQNATSAYVEQVAPLSQRGRAMLRVCQ